VYTYTNKMTRFRTKRS